MLGGPGRGGPEKVSSPPFLSSPFFFFCFFFLFVFLFSFSLDEQYADDNDDDAFKIESAQPVSDTFCELVPEFSRKLQLEHHLFVRLLKAVYGLVNALESSETCGKIVIRSRNSSSCRRR